MSQLVLLKDTLIVPREEFDGVGARERVEVDHVALPFIGSELGNVVFSGVKLWNPPWKDSGSAPHSASARSLLLLVEVLLVG